MLRCLDLADMDAAARVHRSAFDRALPTLSRFYEARGFALVRETDGSGNEEREPDALYLWTR